MIRRSRLRRQSPRTRDDRALEASVRAQVVARCEGRCEVHRIHRGTDLHHTLKPRRTFTSPEWCVWLCRAAHEDCDAPYSGPRGRLVIKPIGDEEFLWDYFQGPDKHQAEPRQVGGMIRPLDRDEKLRGHPQVL